MVNSLLNNLGKHESGIEFDCSFDEKVTECNLAISRAIRIVNDPFTLNSSLHNGLPDRKENLTELVDLKLISLIFF